MFLTVSGHGEKTAQKHRQLCRAVHQKSLYSLFSLKYNQLKEACSVARRSIWHLTSKRDAGSAQNYPADKSKVGGVADMCFIDGERKCEGRSEKQKHRLA